MDVVEKAILMAGIIAEQVETFLKKNGVNPGNIRKYELIQKQDHKNMELILKKKTIDLNFVISKMKIVVN